MATQSVPTRGRSGASEADVVEWVLDEPVSGPGPHLTNPPYAEHAPHRSRPAVEDALDDGPDRRRRPWPRLPRLPRRARAGLIALALVAGLALAVQASRTPALRPSLAGVRIENPGDVLTVADRQFLGYVRARHGRTAPGSRCYFDRVGAPAAADVGQALYCGPVLFYGGSPAAPYLQFALTATSRGQRVALSVAPTPIDPLPGAVPATADLERTDHAQPPPDAGGLAAPVPPPAARDLFAAVPGSDVPGVAIASPRAIMGGLALTVAVEAVGPIDHFGQDADQHSAPAGQRLIAFETVLSDGEQPTLEARQLSFGVRVDGGSVRPLPHAVLPFAVYGQWFVLAVPVAARAVDLVFTDAGISQSVSLLSGRPNPGNVEVLQRTDRVDPIVNAFDATAVIDDHGHSYRTALTIEKDPAVLGYFGPEGQHPAFDRAYVQVHICYRLSGSAQCPTIRAADLVLTPDGETAIRGGNAGTPSDPYDVFAVPASYSVGDLSLAGPIAIAPGVTMTVQTPISIPIMFIPQ